MKFNLKLSSPLRSQISPETLRKGLRLSKTKNRYTIIITPKSKLISLTQSTTSSTTTNIFEVKAPSPLSTTIEEGKIYPKPQFLTGDMIKTDGLLHLVGSLRGLMALIKSINA